VVVVDCGESISDVFAFVWPHRTGLVASIVAYFDESEREERDEPIAVGGYFFKPSGYKSFSRYWRSNVLRHRGRHFKHFHMTDLVSGNQQYEGVSISDRVDLLKHAIHAIHEYTHGGVVIHFNRAEFEQQVPPDWAHTHGSIYLAACHMCVQMTGHTLDEWRNQMSVLYVFERGHKFQSEVEGLLKAVSLDDTARQKFYYGDHLFEQKTEVGLQGSDFFVWLITKAAVIEGGPPRSLQPFIHTIRDFMLSQKQQGDRYRVYPVVGDMLEKFIFEQTTSDGLTWKAGPRNPALR
jgi:hypothetical protein